MLRNRNVASNLSSRLAKAGHSDHEIMAMGGWETLKEVNRYTKGVRRKRLAENVLKRDQEGQN